MWSPITLTRTHSHRKSCCRIHIISSAPYQFIDISKSIRWYSFKKICNHTNVFSAYPTHWHKQPNGWTRGFSGKGKPWKKASRKGAITSYQVIAVSMLFQFTFKWIPKRKAFSFQTAVSCSELDSSCFLFMLQKPWRPQKQAKVNWGIP